MFSHTEQMPYSGADHLAALLRWRAATQPEQCAYTFLQYGGTETSITYSELDRRAQAVANFIEPGAADNRVLIACHPGLEYITAFFGALYADTVAVPAYALGDGRRERMLPRLRAIVENAGAAIGLTTSDVLDGMADLKADAPELVNLRWIAVDAVPPADKPQNLPSPQEQLAFLMYTSGSTGAPKGVMVSHDNVFHNARHFPGFHSRPCRAIVSWLPFFHDLGLFLGIIHPLFRGVPAALMSPTDFVRRPASWLEAISRFEATTSGGPNFAYELCIRKVTAEQRRALDLSCWNLALNGAEPIRPRTLEQFAEAFEPVGFSLESFYPSYGLSDATATVTGADDVASPLLLSLDRHALAEGQVQPLERPRTDARTLVGCGSSITGQTITIVDPDSMQVCPPGAVGEIWVSGPSVGRGYWNRPQDTDRVFRATLPGTDGRTYLRTGDLGFLYDGQLFIAGRLKDVIIVRGQNYNPEDIELTVERSHPQLRPGCGAAFALDDDVEERPIIVQEVAGQLENPESVIAAIREAVVNRHGITFRRIVLIPPGTLPKTSSGKIRRAACRRRLLAGELRPLAQWEDGQSIRPLPTVADSGGVEDWLVKWLARQAGVAASQIDPRRPLSSFGLDSMTALSMIGDLEQWLGCTLSPSLVWNYPTVEKLAAYLAGESERRPVLTTTNELPQAREPVAIVGLACNFPGAPDHASFWQLLEEKGNAITEVPAARWDADSFYSSDITAPGKLTTRWGGFLANANTFDAGLFGISPREAAHIDPQQRKILEVAWRALEHAGEPLEALAGTATGVFIGICNSDHARLELVDDGSITQYGGTGTAYSLVANRLSYTLDLRGPSMALDTACSSSLAALHLACQSLRSGECERALAGGVNLILSPEITIAFSKARMMAADGRCKTFDAAADGYVRSEGAGVLVLKRLSDAVANGDRVLALVRGTALTQDGRSNGITAPNGLAQESVIRQALQQADVQPQQLGYIEAHGTGTPLGDAIEIDAWNSVLGDQPHSIPIGSVKTNIGHTEAAAGVAGVIKVVLAMMHDRIPAQRYGRTPNPELGLEQSALQVAVEPRPWPADPTRRFATVSSFGFGGTNASAVLEKPPAIQKSPSRWQRSHHLLLLSGRGERALKAQVQQMSALLAAGAHAFADVCYTAACGRTHLNERLALVAEDGAEAATLLDAWARGERPSPVEHGTTTRDEPVVFVFAGQGTHYLQMGRDLYESHPLFRATIDECQRLLEPYLDRPLCDYLYPESASAALPEDSWQLQPALFAVEYALARLWMSWGVEPAAVLGHSLGEYVAACIAGVMSLADALKLIAFRARLVDGLPKDGAMAAIMASADVVHGLLAQFDGAISVASYNNPGLVIVTGARTALQTLAEALDENDISYRSLPIANAFHSPAMRPIADEFAAITAEVAHAPPQFPLVANLTGALAEPGQIDSDYWVRHLLEPVQFQQSIETLLDEGYELFLEMGPRPTLGSSIKRIAPSQNNCLTLSSLSGHADRPDWPVMLSALGQLHLRGVPVDWRAVESPYRRSLVTLPPYPFDQRRFPIGRAERRRQRLPSRRPHPLVDCEVVSPQLEGAVFQRRLSVEADRFLLSSYTLLGERVLPAGAQIELMVAAGALQKRSTPTRITDLALAEPFVIEESALMQALLPEAGQQQATARIMGREGNGPWEEYASGKLSYGTWPAEHVAIEALRSRCSTSVDVEAWYAYSAANGVEYGHALRSVRRLWKGERELVAQIDADEETMRGYRLAVPLLEGAFQALAAAIMASGVEGVFRPVAIDDLRLHATGPLPSNLLCHGVYTAVADGSYDADLAFLSEDGQVLVAARGVRLQKLSRPHVSVSAVLPWLKQPRWQAKERPAPTPQEVGTWLIFDDASGVGSELAARLEARGNECLTVLAGDRYECCGDTFVLRPGERDDYAVLARALADRDLHGVAHIWSCRLPESRPPAQSEIDHTLERGAISLLYLIQALSAAGGLPRYVAVATSYAQAVDEAPDRPVEPLNAAIWGLSKVVACEYAATTVLAVDLEPAAHAVSEVAAQLLAELEADHEASGNWVIYHDGRRFEATLDPVGEALIDTPVPLREDGVYVISGGQGGLGLEFARWIAHRVSATLLLVNRTPLDEGRHPERVQGVRSVERLGATVEAVSGDVSDVAAMARLVESAVARHGRLDGVIHAAGVLDDASLWNMERACFDRVLRPKVHGTLALAHALQDVDLDFFVICSSMASLKPTAGQGNHVAANAVQDALAHVLRRAEIPALSINWGLWGETGVVAEERYLRALRERDIHPLTNAEGVAGLEAALRSGLTQVAFAKEVEKETAFDAFLQAVARDLATEQDFAAMAPAAAELDRLCSLYTVRALAALGLNPLLHSHFTTEQLAEAFQIAGRHRPLFARLLTTLADDGVLIADGEAYHLASLPSFQEVGAAAAALGERYPGLVHEIELVQRCGDQLAAVLGDKVDPLSLIFPGGASASSLKRASAMYEQSAFSQFYNRLAAKAVAKLGASGEPLTILEVGAGTGGTTSYILEALGERAFKYTFTDISHGFLLAAQQKFDGQGAMDYKTLDLQQDLIDQGEQPASYDVIVAANVIHATSDVVATVNRLRSLLVPGGALVIVELVRPQRWLDITFGLTRGWWNFAGDDRRPDYPLLDVERWRTVIQEAGLVETAVVEPLAAGEPLPVEQAVIVAKAPATTESVTQRAREPVQALPVQPESTLAGDLDDGTETPRHRVRELLTGHVRRVLELGDEPIPPTYSFHDLGLDSLLAVEIAGALQRDLEVQLSPTLFFEHPSVGELSDYICTVHAEAVARHVVDLAPQPVNGDQATPAPAPKSVSLSAIASPNGNYREEDVAVVGMACRFPGAPNLGAFWEVLRDGVDAVGEIPADRWDWRDYFDETPGLPGKSYSRWGGFLEEIDRFDARFFSISPKEAMLMDPQQRIFLEVAWHALEHAGYAGRALAGSATAVFVGCSYNHYREILGRSAPAAATSHFAALGNNHSVLANRLSYFLDLNGPSLVVDTLCSSSLAALHMACRSIRDGECDAAIVGGVNLLLDANHYLNMSQMRAYAPDGRCKAFDHRADGFVSGEGIGVVVVKPLQEAVAAGDTVYAVIKGSAINHNGRTNGMTAPHPDHQAETIRRAHRAAGWDPATVGYIEAHGTGTALGDPIEVKGLSQVFAAREPNAPACYLGSVKSNLGHLESAAGMAGLIKTVLALRRGVIPPTLHFELINPYIDLEHTPFQINAAPVPWNSRTPRRAGVSAFGLGGVNAHVALEEWPARRPAPDPSAVFLLPMSATSKDALHNLVERYLGYLATSNGARLLDVCYTASVGRGHFGHRLAVVAEDRVELRRKLKLALEGGDRQTLAEEGVFSGVVDPEDKEGAPSAVRIPAAKAAAPMAGMAEAYVSGRPVAWESIYAGRNARRVALPAYPFARERYWFEEEVPSRERGRLADGDH